MSRLRYCALFLLLWAAVYLPGLGSTELKGEEGRRILPAITMLETGHWLVPYVGGEPFLRKPPLINWAIAGAFQLTGVRNEWTARLPSALCVLLLGLFLIATSLPRSRADDPQASPGEDRARRWITPPVAFVAAIFATTFAGLLAKARFAGAEIEGLYVPLAEIALGAWLAGRAREVSPWIYWPFSGALLGVASLAKGPSLHLLFFYAVVVTVLVTAARRQPAPGRTLARDLLHPAHLLALGLCAAIFAAWAVPYFRSPEAAEAAAVWKRQGIDRFTDSDFDARNYLLNLPRALSDLLPWLLLAPYLRTFRRPAAPGDRVREILRPALLAAGLSFLVVLFIPGTLPRYVLPVGVVLALALAVAVEAESVAIRRWFWANRGLALLLLPLALAAPVVAGYPPGEGAPFDLVRAFRAGLAATSAIACCTLVLARRNRELTASWVAGASAALLGAGMLLYAGAAVKWIRRGETLRPLAAQIDAAVPPGATLTIYDPGYQAWIFYLRSPHAYAVSMAAIPRDASRVLAREGEKVRRKFAKERPDLQLATTFQSKSGATFLLYQPR